MRVGTVMGLAFAFVAGCGYPSAKLEEARGHVQKALETWKAGGSPDALKQQTPPVEFHEAMWDGRQKLVEFEFGTTEYVDAEGVVRCSVRLTFRGRNGKLQTDPAFYDVTLGPTVKVVNNPMP